MSVATTQRAIQLVGPDQLTINEAKPVFTPGRHQVLCRVEVCGLCFSDLKLLKQFSGHARKSKINNGIDQKALLEMPHYVAGDKPTVPGHETVVRIVRIGDGVSRFKVGERYLVQTDYRWLPTTNSASAFGYNFEVPRRNTCSSTSGSSPRLTASPCLFLRRRICRLRPLRYASRGLVSRTPTWRSNAVRSNPGGDALSLVKATLTRPMRYAVCHPGFRAAPLMMSSTSVVIRQLRRTSSRKLARTVSWSLCRVAVNLAGQLFPLWAASITAAFALSGRRAEALPMRWRPFPRALRSVQMTGSTLLAPHGPMGTMHVIRDLCQGVADVTVFAGDLNDERLAQLHMIAEPLAQKNRVTLKTYNPSKDKLAEKFNYIVLMAPVPALVTQAVEDAAPHAIINIFAGIPADKTAEIDLDRYIEKQCYFVGTSGSTLEDMKMVLQKVASRQLDTNLSVAAVAGLDGAIDGIRAVEKNLMPGKIIVYPSCKGLKLTPLTELGSKLPLENGRWNRRSEEALLEQFKEL